jgi:predicted nucleotidyltransferase
MDSAGIEARLRAVGDAEPDLELVVLFGSTAKRRRRHGSDVDVAVRCRASPISRSCTGLGSEPERIRAFELAGDELSKSPGRPAQLLGGR